MSSQRFVEVVADWVGLGGPVLMGHLTAAKSRGKEVFAFEYDQDWLASSGRQQLDPTLSLYRRRASPGSRRNTCRTSCA